jgi:hypothetical protein
MPSSKNPLTKLPQNPPDARLRAATARQRILKTRRAPTTVPGQRNAAVSPVRRTFGRRELDDGAVH